MQYMPQGDLDTFLTRQRQQQSRSGFPFLQKCLIAKQIADGLAWLHHCNPPIVHGNLKPSNILVSFSLSPLYYEIRK